jgi:hypothetical protein
MAMARSQLNFVRCGVRIRAFAPNPAGAFEIA